MQPVPIFVCRHTIDHDFSVVLAIYGHAMLSNGQSPHYLFQRHPAARCEKTMFFGARDSLPIFQFNLKHGLNPGTYYLLNTSSGKYPCVFIQTTKLEEFKP